MSNLDVRLADWNQEGDKNKLHEIRYQVFVEEQKVPESKEWDQQDTQATHFLLSSDAEAIGCARIIIDGQAIKIGRVAILPQYRGIGAGYFLMNFIRDYAEEKGFASMILEAQTQAYHFYRQCGYDAQGTPFNDCDIPHILMQRDVKKTTQEQKPLFVAGEDQERYSMANFIEKQGFLEMQLQQCRRLLYIQWGQLNESVLELPFLNVAIMRLIKRNPKTQVRIMVPEPDQNLDQHPLMVIRERLSSRIELKFIEKENNIDNIFLFDLHGYFSLKGHEGWTNFCDRSRVKTQIEEFDRMWQKARVPHELRRLYL